MPRAKKPFSLTHTAKDIAEFPMEELRQMTPEELLEKFDLVIYSEEDLLQINKGLDLIKEIIKKNRKKLEDRNGKNITNPST